MEKKTKKEGVPFSAQKKSEHQWASSQNLQHSVVQRGTPDPQTGLEIKDKPKQSGISDQLLREDLEQKYSQLFWGLPSLHSESIVATLLVPTVGYSLEPHLVLFNGICKGTSVPVQDGEAPPVLQSHPLPLTFVQPQPFPQIEPQSEVLPPTWVHPQVHMTSPLPHVPSSSSSCGNILHRPENRAIPDILNGNQHLQCPVLQNHPENVWGLVPECQQYEEAFAFPAPSIPLVRQSPQSYVSVPGPCHFHLHSELQENLDPQGPSNLILPWCFQSYSSPGVLTVMDPQFKQTGTSPHTCNCVYSQPSVHWVPSYSDLRIREPSHTESFCERVSIRPQLRKDVARNLGHILGKCPLKNPQVISECYVLNSLNAALETKKNWVCHPRTALENKPLSISRKNLDQNQTKSILRLHMSRKFWQIISGRIPIKVCCSWLADDNTVLPSGNAHTNTDNRASLPFGRVSCYTAIPEIPLLDHKTQQMLEVHLIRFRVNQKWGLPLKVLESIKFYMLREAKTWPLPQLDYPSSPNPISRMNWTTGFPQPPRQSSKSFQGDRVEKRNSVPIMDSLLPAASPVDKEGEGPLRPSHSDTGHEVTEHVQINDGDRQTSLPRVSSSIDKMSQNHTVPENRHAQEQPLKQDVTEPESKTEVVHSNNTEIAEGKQVVEDPEHILTSNMSWKIDKAHEAGVLQSESDPTRKLENSEMTNTSSTLLGTKCDPPRTSTLEDSTIDNFKKQVLKELKFKLDSEFQNQAKGYTSNTSFTSGSFTCDFLPSSSNSVSSEDFSLSQELYTHLEGKGIHMEPRQNPRVFKHVLKDFKPAERRVSLPGCKRKSGRNEISDLELEIFKAINESQPGKKGKSDRRPSPPESYFRKIRQAFQWFNFGRENTGRRSPEKDRALFMSCGPPEAHDLMAALGKILEEKLCGRKAEFLEWSQKKKDLQAQPKPIKRQSSNPGTAYTQ